MGNMNETSSFSSKNSTIVEYSPDKDEYMKFHSEEVEEVKKYMDGIKQIEENELEIKDNSLGKGRSGKVWEAIYQNLNVAVKNFAEIDEMMQEARNEMKIMQRLNHQGIVKFHGGIITTKKIQIVMQKMDGTLFDLLTKGGLDLYKRISYVRQTCDALRYLHKHRVLHGDYKTENVLYCQKSDSVKISDFGFSQIIPPNLDTIHHTKGSLFYLAPEIFKTKKASFASDVYSFGISLAVHITQDSPYEKQFINEYDFLDLVCAPTNLRPTLPFRDRDCPPSLRSLCESCWNTDPSKRPSFEEISIQLDCILYDCILLQSPIETKIDPPLTEIPSPSSLDLSAF